MGRGSIYLVGMMGAGKTTVGRALAQRMQMAFADTDKLLVERTGVSVGTIFEIEGEEGFRRREACMLEELSGREDCVIATGGGAVLRHDNRTLLRSTGTVVYLRARVESLWQRMRNDTTRPLLATADPRATLTRLLAEREALYEEVAHVIVDTGLQSTGSLVARVVVALREHAAGAPR
ncbi:MAG TPA: shikimate kinase [Usitatibacter sp.]|nr:shikimate kinase [Usitatibacter sp.]